MTTQFQVQEILNRAFDAESNSLNVAEFGTWTPAVTYSTGTTGLNITTQTGYYTKVGRLVTVQGRIAWDEGSSTGNLSVTGLPFTTANDVATQDYGFAVYADGMTGTVGSIIAFLQNNATTFTINDQNTGAAATITEANTQASNTLAFTFSYFAAA